MSTEQTNMAVASDGRRRSMRNGHDTTAAEYAPNLDEAARFLALLEPNATQFTFQTFDDVKGRKNPALVRIVHGGLDDLTPELVRLNRAGAGVFVTVNATDFKGREAANIVRTRAVWQDDDTGHDWTVPLAPSIVVNTSPGKHQRYLLADGLTLEDHAAALERMVQKHGCDPGAKGANRVLRLPGFYHMKRLDQPHLVRIVEATGKRYSRAEILGALPPAPRPDSRGAADLRAKLHLLSDAEVAKAKGAAAHLNETTKGAEFTERATWLVWGQALHHATDGHEQGVALWSELSGLYCPNKFDPDDQRRVWDSFRGGNGKPLTLGTIYRRALDQGWADPTWPELVKVEQKVPDGNGGTAVKTSYKPAVKSRANIEAFLREFGISVYWDEFARDFMVEGFEGYKRIDDHAVRSLWFEAQARGLPVANDREFFVEAIKDIARADTRNPVKAYLARVEADYRDRVAKVGEPEPGRTLIERLLVKYAGAEDTPLNRAFVRKWLIAAVRRARKPGTKFDAMLVLESPEGMGKSTLPKVLASTEWFEENTAFGATARAMIQQTAGKWIVEMAELVGIGIKEIEAIKIELSRTHDRSDLKYDKFATDAPRHFVFIGTTNDSTYLRSKTGNRRFWPIGITKEITEKRIAAIRDHLWGEAAYFEAQGESIELPRELWGEAREAQQRREVVDPLLEILEPQLRGYYGSVSLDALWGLAGYDTDAAERKNQSVRTRLGIIMEQSLGWQYERWTKTYRKPVPPGHTPVTITANKSGVIQGVPPDAR